MYMYIERVGTFCGSLQILPLEEKCKNICTKKLTFIGNSAEDNIKWHKIVDQIYN